MLPLAVAGAVVVAAPHILAAGYVLSIATGSLNEKSRTDLLNHVEAAVPKLQKMGHCPSEDKLVSLLADITLLRKNLATGWVIPNEYGAATRLARFMGWEHLKDTARGTRKLFNNCLDPIVGSIAKTFDDLVYPFGPAGNPDGNIRT